MPRSKIKPEKEMGGLYRAKFEFQRCELESLRD